LDVAGKERGPGWHRNAQDLRNDDPPRHQPPAHPEAAGGLDHAGIDGGKAGTEDLALESNADQDEGEDGRADGPEVDADIRQRQIADEQHDEFGNAPEYPGIDAQGN